MHCKGGLRAWDLAAGDKVAVDLGNAANGAARGPRVDVGGEEHDAHKYDGGVQVAGREHRLDAPGAAVHQHGQGNENCRRILGHPWVGTCR